MKFIKKRLFSLKSFLLLILLLLTIASIFIVVQRGKIQENSKSIIEKQRFIETHILSGDDNKESISAGFDLKEKEFFYYHGAAIKNNKLYGGSQEYSAAEYYKRALDIELTSALLNHQINIKDIKDSNYQITRSTDSFINKKLLEEKHPPEFEGRYSIKDSQFSKVRITYNKEFLPTKIEWYYKGEEGLKWYTWRTYSYPFKNKSDFDKKLDEEIENIKEIQEENEGD
ncbi:hypothetical protein [Streptococcus parasanguinis]|uniref:hypothetical protein n=1 Tax=Streptococcus parasanguinis TaxID=1318 RepID=UPI001F4FEC9A|nr:hypothetical protein [Streptococcus parasanguinis]